MQFVHCKQRRLETRKRVWARLCTSCLRCSYHCQFLWLVFCLTGVTGLAPGSPFHGFFSDSWSKISCRMDVLTDACLWESIEGKCFHQFHYSCFPSSTLTLLVGLSPNQQCQSTGGKGIRPVKKLDVGLLVVMIWLELCTSCNSSCHHCFHHP